MGPYIVAAGLFLILWLYTERKLSMAATRADLDAAIAAAPGAVTTAVIAGITPIIQPLIDRLNASPEDFSAEVAQLTGLGDTIAQGVDTGLSNLVTPPAAPPVDPNAPTP